MLPTTGSGQYLRFDDLRARCAHPVWHLDPHVNVFVNADTSAQGSEQFRTLRSRLYQMRSNQPLRTLLVTSSIPTEGKTFVTNNLAQAIIRQPDRRALIIDADLRRSRLHVPLGAPSSPGLTDYLRGTADIVSIIQQGHEGNLCFIRGGDEVTNPSELIANGRMKMLLDRLAPIFDWIILDSPPCLLVADARSRPAAVPRSAVARSADRRARRRPGNALRCRSACDQTASGLGLPPRAAAGQFIASTDSSLVAERRTIGSSPSSRTWTPPVNSRVLSS